MRGLGAAVRPVLCLLGLTALLSCSGPVVVSVGDSNDLVVICDAGAPGIAELTVETLEAGQSWLLGEPLFKTTLTTPERSGDLKNMRHVLLVGAAGDGAAEMAGRVFPGLSDDDEPELLLTEDIWAKRQVVGCVVAPDREALEDWLAEHGEELRTSLAEAAVQRLSRMLRETADEAGMSVAMEERFGWSISPPTGYDLFTTNVDDGFVFFRRTGPDRTVFLYWTDAGAAAVDEPYALTLREEIAGAYFDGDTIEWNRPVVAERVDFLGRDAVRVSGWWGNRTLVGGGPFRSYCFQDEASGRIYLLDVSLFAPSYDKTALMRNLDAIAHTLTLR
jgi:hypothetical protein